MTISKTCVYRARVFNLLPAVTVNPLLCSSVLVHVIVALKLFNYHFGIRIDL